MRRRAWLPLITILCLAFAVLPAAGQATAAPTDEETFLARVRAALEQGDREAIANLSYWEGVDAEQRQRQEQGQDSIFGQEVATIELRPVPPGYRPEYVSRGIEYRVNLPVEGLLRIEFAGEFESHDSRLFPYGIHDGRYFIARVAKVGVLDPADKVKQLFVGVMVPSGPDVADYVVSCSYDKDGEELREKYEGQGSTQRILWGHKINWCRVWNRSGDTSLRLVLKENLETYFESEDVAPGESVAYP